MHHSRDVAWDADLEAGTGPELPPAHDVALEEVIEVACEVRHPVARILARLGHAGVARCEERHDLLDDELFTRLDVAHELERDVARSLDEFGLGLETVSVSEQPRASSLGDPNVRLAGLDF